MDFFEPPAPRRRARPVPEPAPRPWWGAPSNELGAPVPVRLVLARTDSAAVALIGATAYTTGVELRLAVRRRPRAASAAEEDEDELFADDPFEFHPFGHPWQRLRSTREIPPQLLRFGVQFADGRKATNISDAFEWAGDLDEDDEREPAEPVLMPAGGGGGSSGWEQEYWLWPLPAPGRLAFVVEWPAERIDLRRETVDGELFLAASRESEVLWPESDDFSGSAFSVGSFNVHLDPPPESEPHGRGS